MSQAIFRLGALGFVGALMLMAADYLWQHEGAQLSATELEISLDPATVRAGMAEEYAQNPEMRQATLNACRQAALSGKPAGEWADLHCGAVAGTPGAMRSW